MTPYEVKTNAKMLHENPLWKEILRMMKHHGVKDWLDSNDPVVKERMHCKVNVIMELEKSIEDTLNARENEEDAA